MTWTIMVGTQRQRITIGRYPVLSLAQAREAAKRILAERTLGTYRTKTAQFADILEIFISTHCQSLRPSTAYETARLLRKHFLPSFRNCALGDISTEQLATAVDRLLARPSIANHAFIAAHTFFNWAVRRRYIRNSPMEGLTNPVRVPARDRVLSDVELVAVYRAAEVAGFPYGTIVRLLIITGQRRNEINSMRWEYIDQQKRTIRFPHSLTKNHREHTFPYGDMTAQLLEATPNLNTFLFPARSNGAARFSNWTKCKNHLDRSCAIAPWRLHDLRRTFATNLASLGTPPHVVERLLNHSSGTISGIAAIYNRFQYMDEMRAAVKTWEARLAALLSLPM
jgi:integrase